MIFTLLKSTHAPHGTLCLKGNRRTGENRNPNRDESNFEELGWKGFKPRVEWYAVKEAVFPFNRFAGVDPILGPEMKSTGEVMGIDKVLNSLFESGTAAGQILPTEGRA